MGRRSIAKLDPTLDLSRHLKSVDELPRPFSAQVLFGRTAPLEVEVGSGKGLFMKSASQAIADHDFLGIEVAGKYARFAAGRLANANRDNAIMVHGDAEHVFRELLLDNRIAAVHVYFPDPWWKRKHRKRRIMNPAFVRDVQRVLEPGGVLHFWTDVKEYFDEALATVAASTEFEGPCAVPEATPNHDFDYRTHFERRMRMNRLDVFRAEFVKR